MITIRQKIINEYFDIRSLIYTLLIFTSLLFLINVKQMGADGVVYILILIGLILVSISEFLFSIKLYSSVYHKQHELRTVFKRIRKHHMYNIILMPVVQYTICAAIIYFGNDIILNTISVIVTSIMTYFTFYCYRNIYTSYLKTEAYIDSFFDSSRYLSFAFISYLALLLQNIYAYPRSLTAAILGLIQFVYLISSLWRKEKLNFINTFISITVSILLSGYVYLSLILFQEQKTIALLLITSQVVLWDYVITSIFMKWVEKKISVLVILEYILVAMIALTLLYFSK
ncbi:MAG: hypothetical protein WCJ19_00985 [bacterium]